MVWPSSSEPHRHLFNLPPSPQLHTLKVINDFFPYYARIPLLALGANPSLLAYFSQVHPQYPFLEHEDFIKNATRSDLSAYLAATPAFSALYHTVLALGCQYTDGGSFDPGKGKAWKLFQVALGLMPEILVPPESISNVQVSSTALVLPTMYSSLTRFRPLLPWYVNLSISFFIKLLTRKRQYLL
jgi:hypothetical protein